MAASKVQLTISILESYRGRDKVMRTVQFASMMVSGLLNKSTPKSATKLQTIASQLGLCRVILRLFDDIPMIAYNTFAGGLGQKVMLDYTGRILLMLQKNLLTFCKNFMHIYM